MAECPSAPVHTSASLLAGMEDVSPLQRSAARRWQRDWLVSMQDLGGADPGGSGRAVSRHASMLARAAARARSCAVRRGLGARAERHLRLLLIETMSFSDIAQFLMPGDPAGSRMVAAQTSLLLDVLASHYATSGSFTTD